MDRALKEWHLELSTTQEEEQNTSIQERALKLSYTIYGCLLLLPTGALDRLHPPGISKDNSPDPLQRLYRLVAKHLKITHIAINKAIPIVEEDGQTENVIRAPINLQPLYGDFGSPSCSSPPTQEDFDAAFWVTAKQNDIYQTWAPRWTMFSRGNIREKARLLALPSVQQVVDEGMTNGRGCAAVDLYAGIGYFAFSYLKAGVSQVLCWDLNPWSIEGLRRGAVANKWMTTPGGSYERAEDIILNDTKIIVFNESNEKAAECVHKLRARLPPVRHVNCGLLPTSRGSWPIALEIIDARMGGWIHVHENFATVEIGYKVQEVRAAFQNMVDEKQKGADVQVEDVDRLKSYAPGVMHCVIDVYIPPYQPD